MKTLKIYRILILVAIIVTAVVLFPNNTNNNTEYIMLNKSEIKKKVYTYGNMQRESITFILGEDKEELKPYYSLAFDYYKTDKLARTEYINNTCRSLSEVRDYLKNNPSGNGLPWRLINLVTHGNEWYGMSVPVTPDSKRSSTERITEFVNSAKFEALSDSLIDDSTKIFLHGCGLGNDLNLLKIISKAFGGKGKRPVVIASKLKEYYFSIRNNHKILKSQLYYAKTWSVYYKMNCRPDNDELKRELTKLYPNDTVNWAFALKNTITNSPRDIFNYTINIPVYYLAQYNSVDSLPDLSTDLKKNKWISKQKILTDNITKSKIPQDKFNWTIKKIYVKDKNKKNKPAIHVTGWCTVLCVVKPLIIDENKDACLAKPFIPALSDSTFFGKE